MGPIVRAGPVGICGIPQPRIASLPRIDHGHVTSSVVFCGARPAAGVSLNHVAARQYSVLQCGTWHFTREDGICADALMRRLPTLY